MKFTNLICPFLITAFLLIFEQQSQAQDNLLEQEVSISFENVSLKESLKTLEAEAGISTAYNELDLKDNKITLSFEKELLSEVLSALLKSDDLDYKLLGETVIIFRKDNASKIAKVDTIANKKVNHTISGYITDASSSESLIGASVYVPGRSIGTTTNEYGFYSLTLPKGTYELHFSYIGYQSMIKDIELSANIDFTASLTFGNQIEEIIISADDMSIRHQQARMSSHKISMDKIKNVPALMGERDVLKVIQLMPGVQSGSEGTTGLYVRGGGPDQNLMLLDGVPVYNASHVFGFLSTFNGDAIKSVELTKGGFPARYGGRLSSIIDVRMKEGNMREIKGDITVGLISGRFNLEGPIAKDKTSFSFSGRRTWLDLFTSPAQRIANKGVKHSQFVRFNLYDVNAKVNHIFSKKSRLYLSAYQGNDKFNIEETEVTSLAIGRMKWGNRIATARWNYQINPKLFSNTTIYMSKYSFNFSDKYIESPGLTTESSDEYTSHSDILDLGAKFDLNYIPHPKHHIRTGLKYGLYKFTPTTSITTITQAGIPPEETSSASPPTDGYELNAYVEDDMIIGDRIKLNVGVHVANFKVDSSSYTSVQPRVNLSLLINPKSSIKLSATKMTQYLHLLASPGLGLPTDLWVSSTGKIKPENAWQYGIGYTRTLAKGYEFTLEGFFKDMDNLLEYRSGFSIFANSKDWEDKVTVGEGTSYGGELLLEKTTGKTRGWIGYTLSRSTRTFPEVNFGSSFPYKYDRRHDISLALMHKKSNRLDFGLIWVYGTGNTFTLGTTNQNAIGADTSSPDSTDPLNTLDIVNYVDSRNNQRMPAYHRLDLSVNLNKEKKRGLRTWSFGIYNAYARQNPFVVFNTFKDQKPILKQQSLIPFLPYCSYSFKF